MTTSRDRADAGRRGPKLLAVYRSGSLRPRRAICGRALATCPRNRRRDRVALIYTKPSPGIMTSQHHIFRADSAEHIGTPEDAFESDRVDGVPLDDIRSLIEKQHIVAGTTLAALFACTYRSMINLEMYPNANLPSGEAPGEAVVAVHATAAVHHDQPGLVCQEHCETSRAHDDGEPGRLVADGS